MVGRVISVVRKFDSIVSVRKRGDGVDAPGEIYFHKVFKHNVDIWGALSVIMDASRKIDLDRINKKALTELIGYVFIDGGDTEPYDIDLIKTMIRDVLGGRTRSNAVDETLDGIDIEF